MTRPTVPTGFLTAAEIRRKTRRPSVNPMIVVHGPDPQDRQCQYCEHLKCLHYNRRNYYKCDLRVITGGAATDHRLKWPACARFFLAIGRTAP